MRLKDKVAVITGGGSGIGRASALLFAQEGAKIVVADVDEKGGRETVNMIASSGGAALFVSADVSKASDADGMVAACVNHYGKLDILYNNAGIGGPFISIEETEESFYDKLMAINVKGVFLCSKAAVPVMKKKGGGVIIVTASIAGVRPRPGQVVYSTSKAAAIMLTKSLAIELAPFNIRVNCINPVVTDTAFLTKNIESSKLEDAKKGMVSTIPLGRMGRPEDMANAALYLASDESSLVTGVCLDVDGGRGV
jgi:3-oxoacyl-[acyl-carrier protein] reductase